jgi:malate dehydrogenase (oxaloacetate-decarboxylating)(NADP+)
MADPDYFASMMVHMGDATLIVTGATQNYADCVRPIFEIIGPGERRNTASGLNLVIFKNKHAVLCRHRRQH